MDRQRKGRRFCIIMMAVIAALIIGSLYFSSEKSAQTLITFTQDTITVSGSGARVKERMLIISSGGTYLISGILEEGQIYVDAGKNERVELVLNGVGISNETDAAIYIEKAGHTALVLKENTNNILRSGAVDGIGPDKAGDKDADGAAVYAKGDLSITGPGALQVAAYIHNGIHTKKRLQIEDGNITIEAVNNALKGKDAVSVTGGNLVITAENKGIESDLEIQIAGGNILVTDSTEGIEANQIMITGGNIDITATDDGINASGGAAKKEKNSSDDVVGKMPNLRITGGEVRVNAQGDGLDSNGNLIIEGGNIIIDGPTKDSDGALDYGIENGGVCTIDGGTVLAIGSAGMAATFDESSKQCSFCHICEQAYQAGSEILIYDGDGNELCRHTAVKKGASVVFSAPALISGTTCFLCIDKETVEIKLDAVSNFSGQGTQ